MSAESDALSYWPVTIVPERKRSHMAPAHYGFILKLSRHEWQKHKKSFKSLCVIQWKQLAQLPLSCTTEKFLLFLPLMMFSVAKQRVMMAGHVSVSLFTGTKP